MLNRATLKKIDIFAGLNKAQLDELMGWLQAGKVRPNTIIFREGEVPEALYVLMQGKVAVVKSSAKGHFRLSVLEAPTIFGEASLLIDGRRSTSIRTMSECLIGKLPKDLFNEKVAQPNLTALLICVNLGKLLGERLITAGDELARLNARSKALETGKRFRERTA